MPMLNNAYYRYNSGVYVSPIAVAPPLLKPPSVADSIKGPAKKHVIGEY